VAVGEKDALIANLQMVGSEDAFERRMVVSYYLALCNIYSSVYLSEAARDDVADEGSTVFGAIRDGGPELIFFGETLGAAMPNEGAVWFGLGSVQQARGNVSDAMVSLENAVKLLPDNAAVAERAALLRSQLQSNRQKKE
jgi:cytochrome c-type biogenesis protein CcmH/NrfG